MVSRKKSSVRATPVASIVIPTYNEGKYLPRLLGSIKSQDFSGLEIIVSDAPSTDDTQAIARKFGCRIVMPSSLPSIARNLGARAAKADTIIFLDADNILPPGFLRKLLYNFRRNNYVCASVFYRPNSSNLFDKLGFTFYNAFCWLMQRIQPASAGWCIIIKASVFKSIGGFDESLRIAEDFDLVQRASKHGRFGFMKSPYLLVSTRRLEKEGRLLYSVKSVAAVLLQNIVGKKRIQRMIPYEFGKF